MAVNSSRKAGSPLDPRRPSFHGPIRRPAVEVVADDAPLLAKPSRHVSAIVEPEQVEALPTLEIDCSTIAS
jgi:hypothetical protein